jgi:hypothetical protein
MRIALEDLKLERLDVLYDGDATFELADKIRAVPMRRLTEDVGRLG